MINTEEFKLKEELNIMDSLKAEKEKDKELFKHKMVCCKETLKETK